MTEPEPHTHDDGEPIVVGPPASDGPPVGTVMYTFPMTLGATIYDIYVAAGPDGTITIEVPRRFWFGKRKITLPLPGHPQVPLWRINAETGEIEDHGNLTTAALAPKDQ